RGPGPTPAAISPTRLAGPRRRNTAANSRAARMITASWTRTGSSAASTDTCRRAWSRSSASAANSGAIAGPSGSQPGAVGVLVRLPRGAEEGDEVAELGGRQVAELAGVAGAHGGVEIPQQLKAG